MDSIIFSRIKELCAENSITLNKLEAEIGISTSSISKWKHTVSPTIDKIAKVANYFGVSIDYLVGASDIKSTADALASDPDYISLQRARERMTDKDKTRMMGILRIGFDYAFSDVDTSPEKKSVLSDT